MSSYTQFTHQDFDAEYAKRQKLSSKVAWYHPKEDAIYVSNNDRAPTYDAGMKIVPSVAAIAKAKKLKAEGKINSDQARFSIYNKHDGWQDAANEYFEDRKIKGRTAGVMTPTDYSGVEVTNVLSTLLGLPERAFVLQNAPLTIPTPYLDVRADVWSGFDVSEDIKLGAEIPTGQGTLTSTTYTLKLNAAHIAMYDETTMKPHYWDIWRQNLENIARRMVKKKAQLIQAELETASTSTGVDWGVSSGGLSTNNPVDQLGTAADTIVQNDGNPDSIAMHDRAFRDFISNTFVHGTSQNMPPMQSPGAAKIVNITGVPYTFYVDNLMTNTVAVLFDKQAIAAFQGPTMTAGYRDPTHRYDGYIVVDYFLAKITQTGKIRKVTPVSA
jgi:hypothetical protein